MRIKMLAPILILSACNSGIGKNAASYPSNYQCQSHVDCPQYATASIMRNWHAPTSNAGPAAVVQVHLAPSGKVTSAVVLSSSGDNAFDASAQRAVLAASPLAGVAALSQEEFNAHLKFINVKFWPGQR